ncbi:MAG: nitroreductase family protein [Armatimonadetes bacterium]|nr:nitroreductase family protein [Armatimonadota bacterium]
MPDTATADLSVEKSIRTRRSIRRYTDEPVSVETVRHLVELAGLAPSGSNLQPWRVVAVMGHDKKQELMAVANNQKQVGGAAAVFVIYSDMADATAHAAEVVHPGDAARRDQRAQGIRDHFAGVGEEKAAHWGEKMCFIFAGFLLLACQAAGYATSPMQGFDAQGVKELLGLPESATVPVIIAMGRPAEEGYTHHRHPVERILRIV